MGHHTASVRWQRQDPGFADGAYSRRHEWHFDGGSVVAASASPTVVPAPWSDASAVDPEEAFVAALASCHMLWFLSLAAAAGHVVDQYEDDAVATLARVAPQRQAITEVVLRPRVTFGGDQAPGAAEIAALHEAAHDHCFLARSVTSTLRIEPRG